MPHNRLRSLAAGVAAALLVVACTTTLSACSPATSAAVVQPGGSSDYLPLAVGKRWELRSRSAPDPMVLEVTGRDGDAYIVRWINPFVRATFRFRIEGTQAVLVGLDMGQGNAPIPPGTVYWDFGLPEGERWQSPIGAGEVSNRGGRVETPAGDYRDTVEVRTIDQQGQSMYWTFARNVGLIRWGQGRDAYLLSAAPAQTAGSPERDSLRKPAAPPSARPRSSSLLIGLDANPHEKHGSGKRAKLAALRQAHDAGMTLLHTAPKWNEFEKSPGRFAFTDDFDAIGEFAVEANLPIALNIRIVDTNQRSLPKQYERWDFDDERMAERLRAALRAFPRAYKQQTRYLAIGNEVDGYFASRRNEIGDYAQLMRRVLDTARDEFPNAQFTINFTFSGVNDMGRYRALTDLTDFASFTYYPLNGDFTMRSPSDLRRDIERMLDVSDGKPLYIQEIGYASAERLNSSPQRQAEFYRNAFEILRDRRDRIIGATFLFMSDLPRGIVELLGGYYRLPNSENFKAYLQTLGVLERDGTPKPAWEVFRREALAIKEGR
jgi:hypothetical protein